MKEVLIGIQARSTSVRLPNKANMPFGSKSILSRIAYQATRVCGWFSSDPKIRVRAAILAPYDDPLREQMSHKYTVICGPEEDVLSRYRLAYELYKPDYIVRITGDCVWLPPRVISKCIRDAVKFDADYCSNVLIRSFMEGYDVEVISAELFTWLEENAQTDFDREHVTTYILKAIQENGFSKNFKVHSVMDEYDLSDIKTSIDTKEEYENAIQRLEDYNQKKNLAALYGSVSV